MTHADIPPPRHGHLPATVSIGRNGTWLCETDGTTTSLAWRDPTGSVLKRTPAHFDVGSPGLESPAASVLVEDAVAIFCNRTDGAVYLWHGGSEPFRLSPELPGAFRDLTYDRRRRRIIAVLDDEQSSLVALPVFGGPGLTRLASTKNTFATPAVSGDSLAWLEVGPDGKAHVSVANLNEDGAMVHAQRMAGFERATCAQPRWSPNGELYWLSNLSGFWNLYRNRLGNELECAWEMRADFAQTRDPFRTSTYGFFDLGVLVCTSIEDGVGRLLVIDTLTNEFAEVPTLYQRLSHLCADARHLAFVGWRDDAPPSPCVMTRDFRIFPL